MFDTHLSSKAVSQVLLLQWQANLGFSEHGNIDFVELFSGEAQVTKYWWPSSITEFTTGLLSIWISLNICILYPRSEQGYRSCKVDISYSEAMDFEKSGCFLKLGYL